MLESRAVAGLSADVSVIAALDEYRVETRRTGVVARWREGMTSLIVY